MDQANVLELPFQSLALACGQHHGAIHIRRSPLP
jgi:hypothetical protein